MTQPSDQSHPTVPQRLRAWAKRIKRDLVAIWIAARDPRTPRIARLVALAVAAYALSPIDLIPDFIPVLGYLDDVLLVPLGLLLAIRLIPAPLMQEFRKMAESGARLPASRAGLILVMLIWLAALLWLGSAALGWLTGGPAPVALGG